jgi:hypothetical protein
MASPVLEALEQNASRSDAVPLTGVSRRASRAGGVKLCWAALEGKQPERFWQVTPQVSMSRLDFLPGDSIDPDGWRRNSDSVEVVDL